MARKVVSISTGIGFRAIDPSFSEMQFQIGQQCQSGKIMNTLGNFSGHPYYRKDAESLYHSLMYSPVSLLLGIYPLPAMHSLLVTLISRFGYIN